MRKFRVDNHVLKIAVRKEVRSIEAASPAAAMGAARRGEGVLNYVGTIYEIPMTAAVVDALRPFLKVVPKVDYPVATEALS